MSARAGSHVCVPPVFICLSQSYNSSFKISGCCPLWLKASLRLSVAGRHALGCLYCADTCVLFVPLSASICTEKYYKHNVMKLIQHNGAFPVKPASTNKEIVEGRSSRHGSRTVFLLSLPNVFSPSSRSQLCRKVWQVYNQPWPVFLQLLHSWYVVKFSVYSISKP